MQKQSYSEAQYQCAVVALIKEQLPYFEKRIILINNNAKSGREGAILEKLGLRKGASDFMVLIPNHTAKVLFVEMKVNTKLSNEQKEFRQMCIADGYLFCKCQNSEELKIIMEILKQQVPNEHRSMQPAWQGTDNKI